MASSIDNAFITQYGRRKPKMPQKRTRPPKTEESITGKIPIKKAVKQEIKRRKLIEAKKYPRGRVSRPKVGKALEEHMKKVKQREKGETDAHWKARLKFMKQNEEHIKKYGGSLG